MERNNRPVAVNLAEESNVLGLNAVQSWCSLNNFLLIFEDLVTSTDQHWGLLLLLLQIMFFSPMLSQGMCVYLKHLIVEQHVQQHIVSACAMKVSTISFKKQLKSFKNITKKFTFQN